MTEREQIEQRICEILATETRAVPLSEKLFSQTEGLFGRLAATEEERQRVARSPLFRQALHRLSELQQQEREILERVVHQVEGILPEGYALRLESSRRP
jgi:hypothetical protein